MTPHYVEVVSYETGKVEERRGPYPERRAEKIAAGMDVNLDHERYYTRVVPSKEATKA